MRHPTDRELLNAVRAICNSPNFTDAAQRLRVIRTTIDVHRPLTLLVDEDEVPADPAPVEFIDAGTPAEFARALSKALDDGDADVADALAAALTEERKGGAQ